MSTCTVVTVTYNAERWLPDFLASISDLRLATSHSLHVVAIDNASSDNTGRLLEAAQGLVEYIANSENVGVAIANNQGIRIAIRAGSDYVLLLNNDTRPPSNLLESLIDAAERMPADMVSAILVEMDDPDNVSYCGARIAPARGFRVIPQARPTGEMPFRTRYAPTAALLVATSVFTRIGLMDERFFVYADDLDFMIRADNAGLRTAVDPRAVVAHATSSSTGGARSEFTVRWAAYGRAIVTSTYSHGSRRAVQALYLIGWSLARMLTRQATPHATRIRLGALRRGWRVGRTVAPLIRVDMPPIAERG